MINYFILLLCSSYINSYSYYEDDTFYDYEVSESSKREINMKGNVLKKFALQAALTHSTSNLVCSPVSVLMPLGKLALGVSRKSHELYDAVGVKSRKLKKYFKKLISNLNHVSGVALNVASKIYISNRKRINVTYMSEAKSTFGSGCEVLDFGSPSEAARVINHWVYEKTNSRIAQIVNPSEINNEASMVIVNAVYFMGRWVHEFNSVYKQTFYTPSGSRDIDMMHVTARFDYYKSKSLDAEVIKIPYNGEKTYLTVILPKDKRGLPRLLKQLNDSPDKLNSILGRTHKTKVMLSLPKFRIETRLDLTRLYEKIGLNRIFRRRETGIDLIVPDEQVYVSTAVHKAVIEVNEKHTEGAAASALQITPLSYNPNQVKFTANRPFLFYIISDKQQIFSGIFNGYSNL